MKVEPMIAVRDVEASSRWYQQVLGCQSGHGGPEYEQLVNQDGELLLQLHHWHADEHANMGDPEKAPHGYGVLLWFRTPDFDQIMERARAMGVEIVEEPKTNPLANHREAALRDPDGYTISVCTPYGKS